MLNNRCIFIKGLSTFSRLLKMIKIKSYVIMKIENPGLKNRIIAHLFLRNQIALLQESTRYYHKKLHLHFIFV